MIRSSVTAKKICDLTDTHLISINGSLFFYGLALELKKYVDQITEKKNSKVILDLSGCPIADAGGLGEIVRSYTKILRNNGSIILVNPGKKMRGMFKLTKLDMIFDITDDIESAVGVLSDGHKAVGKAATL